MLIRIKGNIPTRFYLPLNSFVPDTRLDVIFKQKELYLLSLQKDYKY